MATLERNSIGFSHAAHALDQAQQIEAKRNAETVTFSNLSLLDQLIDAFIEASSDEWDGPGSVAVERETLLIAKQFVESLPSRYRTPEITPEPDGYINLEWFKTKRRLLTVSVSPDGRLHWAALIGDEDPRGSCFFSGKAPKTLLHILERVCQG